MALSFFYKNEDAHEIFMDKYPLFFLVVVAIFVFLTIVQLISPRSMNIVVMIHVAAIIRCKRDGNGSPII
ncbi:hypothetical protein SAMN05192569_100295 [Parageobacillus thermantarcticus]|uniref:Uncharacterized protein n=1 Tax=Parageobacillus thermantarcticus TaxID=186116 RepID=A0A1I0SLT4_9BACL|nr:hypothetical protein SAMN05192569_100295 [Parageobacillus thermantarcticus]